MLRHGPSLPALRALDAIHDRLESPADRLLRHAGARSSYLVLPLFALANAGVALTLDVLRGHEPLMLAIIAGLVIGKPLGLVSASALAVRLGIAVKPDEYSWRQLAGAGALAGIGFTMSLFIAGQAFPAAVRFRRRQDRRVRRLGAVRADRRGAAVECGVARGYRRYAAIIELRARKPCRQAGENWELRIAATPFS